MADNKNAEKGNIFVLTEHGYKRTPENVKSEREIGSPVKGFEYRVPASWIEKGYVREVKQNEVVMQERCVIQRKKG
ncbi:MAG: hypothetical protein NC124_21500 [Clostridium sp.]|nr:hypothetical protein [Clostridium sp.]